MAGVKHLIECHCKLRLYRDNKKNIYHKFPVYSLTAIHLARHRVERVPYQPLGGYIESHMEWEVVGTGYLE